MGEEEQLQAYSKHPLAWPVSLTSQWALGFVRSAVSKSKMESNRKRHPKSASDAHMHKPAHAPTHVHKEAYNTHTHIYTYALTYTPRLLKILTSIWPTSYWGLRYNVTHNGCEFDFENYHKNICAYKIIILNALNTFFPCHLHVSNL